MKFKYLLSLDLVQILSFFIDREKEPRSRCHKIWQTMFAKLVLPPCAPADLSRRESRYLANISSTGFIWIKKGDRENFKLQRTAVKYSANTIWLLLYLFVESPCLRADPYKIAENFGAFRLRTN